MKRAASVSLRHLAGCAWHKDLRRRRAKRVRLGEVNFETFQNLSLEALVAWNLHLKPDLEPLLGPLSWNLATFQNQTVLGTLEPSKPVLGTRVFVDLLDPSLATWNLETLPGTLTENLRNSCGLYLESSPFLWSSGNPQGIRETS